MAGQTRETGGGESVAPLVVYLGPTLAAAEAAAILPRAAYRPPVGRGDLYRARERGTSLFLIVDGLFFERRALPPREVLDVLADGAVVAGASSLGAIRAAECWPAGMRGLGSIYRLYRRGLLASDDEVAVVCDPEREYASLSLALVNVRHAASHALRAGWIDEPLARRLVEAGRSLHYAERSWPAILRRAEAPADDERLARRLSGFDLKRKDALHALAVVARWLERDPAVLDRPRQGVEPFTPSELRRERPHRGAEEIDDPAARRRFVEWMIVSGRVASHRLAVLAADASVPLAERLKNEAPRAGLLAAGWASGASRRRPVSEAADLERAAALRLAVLGLGGGPHAASERFAAGLLAELSLAGELEAEVLRWRAIERAAARARRLELEARPKDRALAEAEIAQAHGLLGWDDLYADHARDDASWTRLVAYRDQLALAKKMRERLFNPPPTDPPSS